MGIKAVKINVVQHNCNAAYSSVFSGYKQAAFYVRVAVWAGQMGNWKPGLSLNGM